MSTQFQNWVTVDGSSEFPAIAGRYHLYIALGCPWAHCTALLWKLKGLEDIIGLTIVDRVIVGDRITTTPTQNICREVNQGE